MRISAKTDYALRALVQLASRWDRQQSSEYIAQQQDIPQKFLEAILSELRRTHFITSQRGPGGGHRLKKDPADIAVADILRALNGPLFTVRGECPEDVPYDPPARSLQPLWIATRVSLRRVLEQTTLADLVSEHLPTEVEEMTREPLAWVSRIEGVAQ